VFRLETDKAHGRQSVPNTIRVPPFQVPLPSLSSQANSLPSPFPRHEAAQQNPARRSGERCKLPSGSWDAPPKPILFW